MAFSKSREASFNFGQFYFDYVCVYSEWDCDKIQLWCIESAGHNFWQDMIGSHSKECWTPDSPQAKMDNSLCNLSHRILYNGKEIHQFQLENCTYYILLITRDLVNH